MELSNLVACICEGSAEKAIMRLFLENDLLIFKTENLLDEDVLSYRDGKPFEERYLRKGFDGKISVASILDSHRENFRLSKAYKEKVSVINVVTAPEIEMLIILSEGRYNQFKKSGKKPSAFGKEDLKMGNVKEYTVVRDYFSDTGRLISAVREYDRITKKKPGEFVLADLLK